MISIRGLRVRAAAGPAVLDGIDLEVRAGERVGVVGESGSGKSTLAHAVLGDIRPGLQLDAGTVTLAGQDVLRLPTAELRRLRRTTLSYLPQDPAVHLTPTLRVGAQVRELIAPGADRDPGPRLARVGLPADQEFLRRFPHQLSGGQRQRLALARALASGPEVLVLDEPTTGLDAITQSRLLDQIDQLVDEQGLTLLFITHDLSAVARLADRLVVVRAGRVVEDAALAKVFAAPADPYTRELLLAVPVLDAARVPPPARAPGRPLLRVTDLHAGHGRRPRVITAAGVSLDLAAGECVGLLGLSGAGKTTLARCLTGLHRPDRGTVELDGARLAPTLRRRTVQERRRIQLIAQDVSLSLNPRRTVAAALLRPLARLRGLTGQPARTEVTRLLRLVDLDPALLGRYPGTLSGGQRQRVAVARALAAGPDVLICDEVTASLDVRVQAGVLDLLTGLRTDLGLALLVITHDLGVLARIADRLLVLIDGEVCEEGTTGEVLGAPRHPWTRELLAAAPTLRPVRAAGPVRSSFL